MTPMVPISIVSIYADAHGVKQPLPRRMAQCPPDMKHALEVAGAAVRARGGVLRLSDMFRSHDMQLGSHMDFVSGKKKAFSPPPGGSLHEGGRAFDLDLGSLKMPLADFWTIAADAGLAPIIDTPNPRQSEAWHFECRGSHTLVRDYYKAGKGTNFPKPYTAMAASAIVAIGVQVDAFRNQADGYVQSALIRLGQTIGNLDGAVGQKSRDGLKALGLDADAPPATLIPAVDRLLQQKFPQEFFEAAVGAPGFVTT